VQLTRTLMLTILILALAGCGIDSPTSGTGATAVTPTGALAATATAAPSPAALPTVTAAPTEPAQPTPPPTNIPTAEPIPTEQVGELAATAAAQLPPTATPDPGGVFAMGIEGVQALALTGEGDGLAVVSSVGMRSFEPQQNHFVSLYRRDGQGWQELSRLELETPDYMETIEQAQLAPGRIWLTVESGVGAHSGCFDLLSSDGSTLKLEVEHCNSSPGAGSITDIDGNGTGEVLLNTTDNYVSCYACGLRYFGVAVQQWDGSALQDADYRPVGGAASDLSEQAVALARAGLWKDALPLVAQLRDQAAGNPDANWNAALIELHGKPFAEQASTEGLTPLMPAIFYGDYEAAVDYLREKGAEAIFTPEQSQIFGPEVQGFESAMPAYITSTVEPALVLKPELAPAHFLKGWALALADPTSQDAIALIEEAARLTPEEALYSEALAYLRK
jgi:hypothetical protein